MTPPPAISGNKLKLVNKLYLEKGYCVREVAECLKVSSDAVLYFIRKHKIPKRSYKEAQKIRFENKALTFAKQKINNGKLRELAAIGVALYWAEGYKGRDDSANSVDFANSDSLMVKVFLKFLRLIYRPDESKFRIYLYCYSDQNISVLIDYWSRVTKIPKGQFSKPYVRTDFRKDGRKMKNGMIHVRYHDKKLLLEIKNMIQSYVHRYASVV